MACAYLRHSSWSRHVSAMVWPTEGLEGSRMSHDPIKIYNPGPDHVGPVTASSSGTTAAVSTTIVAGVRMTGSGTFTTQATVVAAFHPDLVEFPPQAPVPARASMHKAKIISPHGSGM